VATQTKTLTFWDSSKYSYPGFGKTIEIPDGLGGTISITYNQIDYGDNGWRQKPAGNTPVLEDNFLSGEIKEKFNLSDKVKSITSMMPTLMTEGSENNYSVTLDFSKYKASATGLAVSDGATCGDTYIAFSRFFNGTKAGFTTIQVTGKTVDGSSIDLGDWILLNSGEIYDPVHKDAHICNAKVFLDVANKTISNKNAEGKQEFSPTPPNQRSSLGTDSGLGLIQLSNKQRYTHLTFTLKQKHVGGGVNPNDLHDIYVASNVTKPEPPPPPPEEKPAPPPEEKLPPPPEEKPTPPKLIICPPGETGEKPKPPQKPAVCPWGYSWPCPRAMRPRMPMPWMFGCRKLIGQRPTGGQIPVPPTPSFGGPIPPPPFGGQVPPPPFGGQVPPPPFGGPIPPPPFGGPIPPPPFGGQIPRPPTVTYPPNRPYPTSVGYGTLTNLTISCAGVWSNVVEQVPGACNLAGVGTNQITWGVPYGSIYQSGYHFDGISGINAVLGGSYFYIGTFTHYNFPIIYSITSVLLSLSFTINGTQSQFSFTLTHQETPNEGAAGTPDIVTLVSTRSQETITINSRQYALQLGFYQNERMVERLTTLENQVNTVYMAAQFVAI
jgi:hypothetical protein